MKEISAKEAFNLIKNNNLILLDTRTQEEYRQAHLKNSILIDLTNPEFMKKITSLNKDKNYLLYCHTGGRSMYVMQVMTSLGYKNISHIQGGIESWESQGLPIEK